MKADLRVIAIGAELFEVLAQLKAERRIVTSLSRGRTNAEWIITVRPQKWSQVELFPLVSAPDRP